MKQSKKQNNSIMPDFIDQSFDLGRCTWIYSRRKKVRERHADAHIRCTSLTNATSSKTTHVRVQWPVATGGSYPTCIFVSHPKVHQPSYLHHTFLHYQCVCVQKVVTRTNIQKLTALRRIVMSLQSWYNTIYNTGNIRILVFVIHRTITSSSLRGSLKRKSKQTNKQAHPAPPPPPKKPYLVATKYCL